jgi:hypothetical protein
MSADFGRFWQILEENTAIDAGIYPFDILRNSDPTYVVARYTYVYERIDGRWKIASHHSSAMPQPVTSRPPRLQQAAHDAGRTHGAKAETAHGNDHAEAPAADDPGAEHGSDRGAGHAAGR